MQLPALFAVLGSPFSPIGGWADLWRSEGLLANPELHRRPEVWGGVVAKSWWSGELWMSSLDWSSPCIGHRRSRA